MCDIVEEMGQLFKVGCDLWWRPHLFGTPSSSSGPCLRGSWRQGTGVGILVYCTKFTTMSLKFTVVDMVWSCSSTCGSKFPFLVINVTLFKIHCDAGHLPKVFSSRQFVMRDWRDGRFTVLFRPTLWSHGTQESQGIFFLFVLNQKKKFRPSWRPKNHIFLKSWSK